MYKFSNIPNVYHEKERELFEHYLKTHELEVESIWRNKHTNCYHFRVSGTNYTSHREFLAKHTSYKPPPLLDERHKRVLPQRYQSTSRISYGSKKAKKIKKTTKKLSVVHNAKGAKDPGIKSQKPRKCVSSTT